MKAYSNLIEIAKNEILRDLIRDGQVHLIRILLETKFGKLPKWAGKRLAETELRRQADSGPKSEQACSKFSL